MQEYQERVVLEKQALDEKLSKLQGFLFSETFAGLDDAERDRMRLQASAMTVYSIALGQRIAAFV